MDVSCYPRRSGHYFGLPGSRGKGVVWLELRGCLDKMVITVASAGMTKEIGIFQHEY